MNTGRRILYNYPYNGIFYDLDGSLTELDQPNTWATANWPHNNWSPECTVSGLAHDGLICDSTIQVRRVVVYKYAPSHLAK